MAGFDGVRASTREHECVRGKKKKGKQRLRDTHRHTEKRRNMWTVCTPRHTHKFSRLRVG